MVEIYFAGTDLGDFSYTVGTPESNATAGRFPTSVQRCVLVAFGEGVSQDLTASVSDLWMSFNWYPSGTTAGEIAYLSGGGTKLFRLYRATGGGNVLVQGWNGSSWSTLLDTGWTATNLFLYRIDIKLVISNSGTVEFYVDGTQQGGTFSGDTLLTAQTTVDLVGVSSPVNTFYFSAIFVSDSDTRAVTMQQSTLSGAGTETSWTGAYTDIDELGAPNDVDFIYSATANDVSTFNKSAFPGGFSSGYNCLGIWVNARALRAASGPQNLQLVCRSGTTNGVSGSKALDVTMAAYGAFFAVDPATTTAWTVSDADSAQPGVKSIA